MRPAKELLYKSARWIYLQFKSLYLSWKVRQTGVRLNGRLSFDENVFFLGVYPLLQGDRLVVYDIGASVGYVSTCLAKVSKVRQVYAFEPIRSVFETLKTRTAAYPHITCFQIALGDSAGSAEIHLNKSLTSSSLLKLLPTHGKEFPWTQELGTESIPIARLDDFAREQALLPADIIKVDVQGFELHVLAGAKQCLAQAKYCILELSFVPLFESGPSFDEIYGALRTAGYRLIGLSGEIRGKSGRVLQVDGIFENTQ